MDTMRGQEDPVPEVAATEWQETAKRHTNGGPLGHVHHHVPANLPTDGDAIQALDLGNKVLSERSVWQMQNERGFCFLP